MPREEEQFWRLFSDWNGKLAKYGFQVSSGRSEFQSREQMVENARLPRYVRTYEMERIRESDILLTLDVMEIMVRLLERYVGS